MGYWCCCVNCIYVDFVFIRLLVGVDVMDWFFLEILGYGGENWDDGSLE